MYDFCKICRSKILETIFNMELFTPFIISNADFIIKLKYK